MTKTITVSTEVKSSIEKVWKFWNEPEHLVKWNFASDDWECPSAENDLRVDGKFKVRMSAKDGSAGFDFEGTYTQVVPNKLIEYTMIGDDKRKVKIKFSQTSNGIKISETFDIEHENSEELQRNGWQTILNNFKKYAENN